MSYYSIISYTDVLESGFFFIENDELREAFQDGCKKIVDKLTALGYTPDNPQGPDEINNAISKVYTERYSEGLSNSSATTGNTKIVYHYHHHVTSTGEYSDDETNPVKGGCYTIANPVHKHGDQCYRAVICNKPGSQKEDGSLRWYYHGTCPVCGGDAITVIDTDHPSTHISGIGYCRRCPPICGLKEGGGGFKPSCGKRAGEIERVEILFDNE